MFRPEICWKFVLENLPLWCKNKIIYLFVSSQSYSSMLNWTFVVCIFIYHVYEFLLISSLHVNFTWSNFIWQNNLCIHLAQLYIMDMFMSCFARDIWHTKMVRQIHVHFVPKMGLKRVEQENRKWLFLKAITSKYLLITRIPCNWF